MIEDVDSVPVADLMEHRELAEQIRALVDTLPCREAMIITLRFGLHDGRQHTLQEIADRLGYTRERIRQLEKQSLRALRSPERNRPLVAWAG